MFFTKIFVRIFFLLNFIDLKKRINFNSIKNQNKKRIYVLNHQSLLDGLIIFLLPGNVKFMANELYAKIPIFGLGVSLTGNIAIKRNSEGEFLSQYYQASDIIEKGYPLAIFPEGTRERKGIIGKFYHSAFMLAMEKKAEIIPVILDTWNTFRPGSYIVRDNDFKVIFLDPITYEEYNSLTYKELSNLVRHKMISALVKIRAEKLKNKKYIDVFSKQQEMMKNDLKKIEKK